MNCSFLKTGNTPIVTILIFIWTLFATNLMYSQNENSKWYFGNKAGLDFMNTPPTSLTGSMITSEACSSVADAAGNLLFYTNGVVIYTSAHNVMANGSSLNGNVSSTQGTLILKKPGSLTVYYVFSLGAFGSAGLYYSEVDMSLAAGAGSVTILNTLVYPNCTEKMAATKHSNGTDFWVVFHDNSTNYRAVLVSAAGVNTTHVVSNIGGANVYWAGCLKFSPNGNQLVAANYINSNCQLYKFNPTTGNLSGALTLPLPGFSAYGCEFSPDGTKLYTSGGVISPDITIVQWNLCSGSSSAILSSSVAIATTAFPSNGMQLGPDNKIYVSTGGAPGFLSVIHSPNNLGSACSFSLNTINVSPNLCLLGLPNLVTGTASAQPPFISSIINASLGCQTASFNISNLSQNTCNFSIDSLRWFFGDVAAGSANTSTLANPLHVFTSLSTYTTHVILYYCCGANSDTLYSTATINQNCLVINSNSITCANLGTATVSLIGGAGPFTYSWIPTSQNNSLATGLYPGSYTVIVYDAGTNVTSSLTTTFMSPIPFTGSLVLNNPVICNGINNGSALVNNLNGTGFYTYLWSSLSSTLISTANSISSLSAGSWAVNVIDTLSHCSFNHTFTLHAANSPTLSVSPPISQVCKGVFVNIEAISNGTLINWQPSNGLNTTIGKNVTASPNSPQIYTITALANGCKAIATVTLNVIAGPTINISTQKSAYCRNEPVELSASGASHYSWLSPQGTTIEGQTVSFNVQLSGFDGNFSVTGTDTYGCQSSASKQVLIKELPHASLHANINNACVPFCTHVQLLKSLKDSALKSLNWSVEKTTFATKNLKYCFSKSGTYSLIHYFIDTLTLCSNTQSILIDALEKPISDFYFTPENPTELIEDVNFTLNTNEKQLTKWTWEIGLPQAKEIIRNTKSFNYTFENAGNYAVALIVENNNGCKDTIIKTVRVLEDFFVSIPNAFSPNNDNLNDIFTPITKGIKTFTFQVFNRWGQKLYETNKPEEGWDGAFEGKACKQDVYVWKLIFSPYNYEKGDVIKQGEVMLLR